MDFEIKPLKEIFPHLEGLFKTAFNFDEFQAKSSTSQVEKFLKGLRSEIFVGIESKYIDKLYRDTYYHYYSSKLNHYHRDCIRLSFFDTRINIGDFQSERGAKKLQKNYLGFLVLRPNSRKCIGRNVLRPDIFIKKVTYNVTTAILNSSINGLKLLIEGFPHTSQDTEFMVCAETTIWSVMEYFGHKYPEYSPALPKKIHTVLSSISTQRQVPSPGLNGLEISYALKGFGFGVKLYTKGSYTDKVLRKVIQMYVESGIPVVTAIKNHEGIAHVNNIIGRTDFDSSTFKYPTIFTLQNGSVLYDFYDQPAKYITIDDNLAPYSPVPLTNPACHHILLDPKWKKCEILAAIVPLHSRIYMEADRAKELAIQMLNAMSNEVNLPNLVLRVLLSSSRSFKNSIALNPDLDSLAKTLIVNLDMSKFVWIAEVGTVNSFKNGKATGMILMDATEPKKQGILAYLLENSYFGPIFGQVNRYTLPFKPFKLHHNLKPF